MDSPRGGGRLQHWTPEQGGGLSIHMTISFFRSHKGYMVKHFICMHLDIEQPFSQGLCYDRFDRLRFAVGGEKS